MFLGLDSAHYLPVFGLNSVFDPFSMTFFL